MFPKGFVNFKEIYNTLWKVREYGVYARVGEVSDIERVSAAKKLGF